MRYKEETLNKNRQLAVESFGEEEVNNVMNVFKEQKTAVEYKLNVIKSDLDFIQACSDNETATENVGKLKGQQRVLEDILEIIEGN